MSIHTRSAPVASRTERGGSSGSERPCDENWIPSVYSRQYARTLRQQRVVGLGWVLRDAERERGVDAAIDVGKLDFEGIEGCRLRHVSSADR